MDATGVRWLLAANGHQVYRGDIGDGDVQSVWALSAGLSPRKIIRATRAVRRFAVLAFDYCYGKQRKNYSVA